MKAEPANRHKLPIKLKDRSFLASISMLSQVLWLASNFNENFDANKVLVLYFCQVLAHFFYHYVRLW